MRRARGPRRRTRARQVIAGAGAGPPAESGHGVALVALPDLEDLANFHIRAQCECGWHHTFSGPVTLSYVAEIVSDHRLEVGHGQF
jgi:hypothetical protein